jgi:glucose/arabinose dehydrogenase
MLKFVLQFSLRAIHCRKGVSLMLRSTVMLSALVAAAPLSMNSCVTTERVASGLNSPVFVTAPPGDTTRLFIVEQPGVVRLMNLGTRQLSNFLDIQSIVKDGGERGLLGLAFPDDYGTTGKFYVNYTNEPNGDTVVAEYRRGTGNPNVADPTSGRILMTIPQPQNNHNGGWIGFEDGLLYIAVGDGGNGNDDGQGHTPGIGNAQDKTENLLGKVLRIIPDVDSFPSDPNRNYGIPGDNPFVGVDGDDEIWAYGLRNPWRCSFDRDTGDLWIGDVGQGEREEINFQLSTSNGGENYGWRLREGTIETPAAGIGGPRPTGNVDPIYDYSHGAGTFQGRSVTGGYVYRGPITSLRGQYIFGDFASQQIWSFTRNGSSFTGLTDRTAQFRPRQGTINQIASFGEDAVGNLYIVDLDGEVFRVTERTAGQTTSTAAGGLFRRLLGDR